MTETHLYLLHADFLLCEKWRVRVSKGVKAQIRGEVQPLFEISEEMCHRRQRDRLRLVAQGAENIAVLCERDTLPQEDRRERLPLREEILHASRGKRDRAGTVCRLCCTLVLLGCAFACL